MRAFHTLWRSRTQLVEVEHPGAPQRTESLMHAVFAHAPTSSIRPHGRNWCNGVSPLEVSQYLFVLMDALALAMLWFGLFLYQ